MSRLETRRDAVPLRERSEMTRPSRRRRIASPTAVREKTLLLRKPLPCGPAAETALQPLIWCSDS